MGRNMLWILKQAQHISVILNDAGARSVNDPKQILFDRVSE